MSTGISVDHATDRGVWARLAALFAVGFVVASAGWLASVSSAGSDDAQRAASIRTTMIASQMLFADLLEHSIDSRGDWPHWRAPDAAMHCAGTSAAGVDGLLLMGGESLPAKPFLLEFDLDGCELLENEHWRANGNVSLRVVPEDWGYSAVVLRQHVSVRRQDGSLWYPVDVAVALDGYARAADAMDQRMEAIPRQPAP